MKIVLLIKMVAKESARRKGAVKSRRRKYFKTALFA